MLGESQISEEMDEGEVEEEASRSASSTGYANNTKIQRFRQTFSQRGYTMPGFDTLCQPMMIARHILWLRVLHHTRNNTRQSTRNARW